MKDLRRSGFALQQSRRAAANALQRNPCFQYPGTLPLKRDIAL